MRLFKWTLAGFALFAVLTAGAVARQETPADLIFATGVLDNIPAHHIVAYRHVRAGPKDKSFHPIADGSIRLAVSKADGGDEAMLEMLSDGKLRSRTPFPAIGNPLVMVFLESSLRATAGITGGSPFYLRNRMKEALRSGGTIEPIKVPLDGKEVDAYKVTFQPFVHDKNAERMGAFSQLELNFVVSPAVPGGFYRFAALTPEKDGKAPYREVVEYQALKDAATQ